MPSQLPCLCMCTHSVCVQSSYQDIISKQKKNIHAVYKYKYTHTHTVAHTHTHTGDYVHTCTLNKLRYYVNCTQFQHRSKELKLMFYRTLYSHTKQQQTRGREREREREYGYTQITLLLLLLYGIKKCRLSFPPTLLDSVLHDLKHTLFVYGNHACKQSQFSSWI